MREAQIQQLRRVAVRTTPTFKWRVRGDRCMPSRVRATLLGNHMCCSWSIMHSRLRWYASMLADSRNIGIVQTGQFASYRSVCELMSAHFASAIERITNGNV